MHKKIHTTLSFLDKIRYNDKQEFYQQYQGGKYG